MMDQTSSANGGALFAPDQSALAGHAGHFHSGGIEVWLASCKCWDRSEWPNLASDAGECSKIRGRGWSSFLENENQKPLKRPAKRPAQSLNILEMSVWQAVEKLQANAGRPPLQVAFGPLSCLSWFNWRQIFGVTWSNLGHDFCDTQFPTENMIFSYAE